jgi:hypothetical protein
VFFGDNQRVPKDKVAQSRLGVEILGFIDDFVLRIGRARHLWYRTKQTIHPELLLDLESGNIIPHFA